MSLVREKLGNSDGQILIFVTLAFVLLGLFVGLAVDAGRAYLLQARLSRLVDAAAQAGARVIASDSPPFPETIAAACKIAAVYGVTECNTPSSNGDVSVSVTVGTVTNPDGTPQDGAIVSASQAMNTTFMRLGALLGCTVCETITVAASGQAAPGLVDLVLVVDDTGTMSGAPVAQGRLGAQAIVDKLIQGGSDVVKIAFVPFRGCYGDQRYNPVSGESANRGCVLNSGPDNETLDLTNNQSMLTSAINDWNAEGGYPGTNVCLGMYEGQQRLFGAGGRAAARKVMVMLTDGDNRYSDGAQSSERGNNPNPNGPFAPPVYPPPQWPNDTSPASHDCRVPAPAQDSFNYQGDYDTRVNDLDVRTNNLANVLKGPSGNNVEIYVLRFADPPGDFLSTGSPPGTCDTTLVGTGSGRENSNDARDRNLSRCLASNTPGTNDHYFYAATPTQINTEFQKIADEILKRIRLVN